MNRPLRLATFMGAEFVAYAFMALGTVVILMIFWLLRYV